MLERLLRCVEPPHGVDAAKQHPRQHQDDEAPDPSPPTARHLSTSSQASFRSSIPQSAAAASSLAPRTRNPEPRTAGLQEPRGPLTSPSTSKESVRTSDPLVQDTPHEVLVAPALPGPAAVQSRLSHPDPSRAPPAHAAPDGSLAAARDARAATAQRSPRRAPPPPRPRRGPSARDPSTCHQARRGLTASAAASTRARSAGDGRTGRTPVNRSSFMTPPPVGAAAARFPGDSGWRP